MRVDRILLGSVILLLSGIGRADEPMAPTGGPEVGRLELRAAVISASLEVRALPKFRFRMQREDGTPSGEVVTAFDGAAILELPGGAYRIASAEPLAWEDEELTWDVPFRVDAGLTTRVELSQDNAQRRPMPRAGRVSDEMRAYERAREGVFLVSADAGVGTGFLVDEAGLVVTNYHVVRKARYIAVLVSHAKKVPATMVTSDEAKDIAVLRVHPNAVAGLPALPLLPEAGTLLVGERILAIGNPLAQESVVTSGIVSKLDDDTIISDVSINPGNSGGPLLNLDGEVVGINTFGLGSGAGPGISGTLRIHLAVGPIGRARAALAGSEPPPHELLPTISDVRFPPERLRAMLTASPETAKYEIEAAEFDVTFFTPPLLHSLTVGDELRAAERQKKRNERKRAKQKSGDKDGGPEVDEPVEVHDPTELIFDWAEQAGVFDAVVIVRAMPEVMMTGGSKAGRIFGALAGITTPATYRFKRDFRELRLLRDGEVVQPIHPGRICEAISMRGTFDKLEDVGCYGQYIYDPQVFQGGDRFTLEVYAEDAPGTPEVREVLPTLIARLRSDLAPYYEVAAAQ